MIVDKRGADSLILQPTPESTRGLAPPWRVKDEIRVRRDTVKELQGAGYTHAQIAKKLGLSIVTIDRDSAFLHQQAREEYQRHVQERIPYEVETTLALYKSIKKRALELADATNSERTQVAALALAKDAGKEAMDLQLRGEYVKRAMDASAEIQKRLNKLEESSPPQQSDQQDSEEEAEEVEEEEEEEEYNGDEQRKF